jgi:ubiquitin related modifier 1
MAEIPLKIEFGGGLELLFDNKRSHRISLPARVPSTSAATTSTTTDAEGNPGTKPVNIAYLIHWLKDNLLRERVELFIENETVYVPYHLHRESSSQRVV